MRTLSAIQETINVNSVFGDKLNFMEKEVEMGFFDNHFFEIKDGIIVNNGCQRISHCSCDCNNCAFLLGIG